LLIAKAVVLVFKQLTREFFRSEHSKISQMPTRLSWRCQTGERTGQAARVARLGEG